MSFAAATAVHSAGEGRIETEIHDGWDIQGNANGGYLIAIAARAMAAACGRPDPITLTAHYLAPGRPGPARVDCRVLKEGRRFATLSATLASPERPLMQLLGAFGDLSAPDAGPEWIDGTPPDLPAPEDCVSMGDDAGFSPAFHHRIDARLHPEDAGFRSGHGSGRAEIRGWFRLRDDEPVDPFALLMALDGFPPTVFNAIGVLGWVPTVEFTCHVRARPAPGWIRARFASRFVSGGALEEDGELWDSEGRLVAQSRQYALAPRGG
jgi:acyl-CoA thioesterase